MLQIQIIKLAILLIGTAYAAYHDHKTSIIPDYLNYSLIGLGAIFLFIQYPLMEAAKNLAIGGVIFGIGTLLYFAGQFGGGDVKLFTAIALFLPEYPLFLKDLIPLTQLAPPYPFVVSIFFLSAVIAVFFVSLIYLKKIWRDRKEIENLREKTIKGLGYTTILIPLFAIWGILNLKMLFLFPPLALGTFLIAFKKELQKRYIAEEKKISDLTEEDVMALGLMDEDKKERLGLNIAKTLPEGSIEKLKKRAEKEEIEKVLVNKHLPTFAPFILISLIINLVFGDFFLWLISI